MSFSAENLLWLLLPLAAASGWWVARFEARMVALDELQQILLSAYDQFVDERQDAATWKRTRAAMRQWVRDRAARA